MGWQDYHLHRFKIEGDSYSVISGEADMLGDDFIDKKKVRLNLVIPGRSSSSQMNMTLEIPGITHPGGEDLPT